MAVNFLNHPKWHTYWKNPGDAGLAIELKFYNKDIPKNKKQLKKKAEQIMSDKLCKCIKKLDPEHESRSIGICTKTIFNLKGYARESFQCNNPRSVKFRKTNKKNKTYKKTNKR